MRSLRLTILGTIIGLIMGTVSVVIAYTSLSLGGERIELPAAIVLLAIGGSTLAGGLCVCLRCLVTRRERSVLASLFGAAVASVIVLTGNYANGSQLPLLIYATAIVNGLLVARAVGPLCEPELVSSGQYLS